MIWPPAFKYIIFNYFLLTYNKNLLKKLVCRITRHQKTSRRSLLPFYLLPIKYSRKYLSATLLSSILTKLPSFLYVCCVPPCSSSFFSAHLYTAFRYPPSRYNDNRPVTSSSSLSPLLLLLLKLTIIIYNIQIETENIIIDNNKSVCVSHQCSCKFWFL